MILTSRWEGRTHESRSGQAGSGTMDSGAAGSSITGSGAAGSLDGTTLAPATPIFQGLASNPVPAGSAAIE